MFGARMRPAELAVVPEKVIPGQPEGGGHRRGTLSCDT